MWYVRSKGMGKGWGSLHSQSSKKSVLYETINKGITEVKATVFQGLGTINIIALNFVAATKAFY